MGGGLEYVSSPSKGKSIKGAAQTRILRGPSFPNPFHIILSSLNSIGSTIVFVWISGDIGLTEHDAIRVRPQRVRPLHLLWRPFVETGPYKKLMKK